MRQIGTQSHKCFRRIVTFLLAFAMVLTSLAVSSVDSQAAAKKVKKVNIGVKVSGSGILVLKKGQKKKLNVSVTPKKASKKVSYKSSNKSAVSVSSKGVVKARKSKGSAKITVTSKQNKKKKATIKVKIGTPVKKVSINSKAVCSWSSANWVLKTVNGQKQKVYPKYKETLKLKKGTYTVMRGRELTLKASVSPKKATSKKLYWKSSKSSVAFIPEAFRVGSSTKITPKKEGTAKITATAIDGSGKKASVKLKVVKFITDKTAAPTAPPDNRKYTMIEDFESYPVGTSWTKYTSAGKNSGHMTVVQDPEDPTNKCLEIKMDGPEKAFDFAPVFSVDTSKLKDSDGVSAAGKTLGNYTTIRADWRVVGNVADIKYKEIRCYFDQFGAIKTTDFFSTTNNETESAHVAGHPEYRFGKNISMATGSDKEAGIKLHNGVDSKEQQKYLPTFHDNVWKMEEPATHFIKDSCTKGFKMTEAQAKVGFGTRNLAFNTTRIKEADDTLLNQTKFDVVLGSTYEGNTLYASTNGSLVYYMDNLALVADDIPVTGFDLSLSEGGDIVYPGGSTNVNVKFTPEDTTQKELIWTSNNAQVTVSNEGKVSVPENFDYAGVETAEVVITATSKVNPALTKSVTIKVCKLVLPTVPYNVDLDAWYDPELSGDLKPEKTVDDQGTECWKFTFTDKNQRIYFKLPEEVNLSAYQKAELKGFSTFQTTLDFYDKNLPEQQKVTDAEWWKNAAIATQPFYDGSSPDRNDKGEFVTGGIETFSELLSTLKSTEATAGNFNAVKYIAIGNACNDNGPGEFLIYSLRLTPKPQGDLPKLPVAEMPDGKYAESMEGESVALQGIAKSTVVEGDAKDGKHYLKVAAGDTPSILIDNRAGEAEKQYMVSAWVKAEDANSGTVTVLSPKNFMKAEYENYEDYDKVEKLIWNQATSQDLSETSEWVQIRARIRVGAGKISEVAFGSEDASFGFQLDNITIE